MSYSATKDVSFGTSIGGYVSKPEQAGDQPRTVVVALDEMEQMSVNVLEFEQRLKKLAGQIVGFEPEAVHNDAGQIKDRNSAMPIKDKADLIVATYRSSFERLRYVLGRIEAAVG